MCLFKLSSHSRNYFRQASVPSSNSKFSNIFHALIFIYASGLGYVSDIDVIH